MSEALVSWAVQDSWVAPAEVRPFEAVAAPRCARHNSIRAVKHVERLLSSNVPAAEQNARKILGTTPGNCDAAYLLGSALRRMGRHAEARAILEPLTVAQPQMALANYELGLVLAALGEAEGAASALLRAIDLDYLNARTWYALGDGLEFAQAQGEDRKSKQQADAALRNGRWSEFESLLQQCLNSTPGFVEARFRYATMLFARGYYARAVPHIDALLKSDPENLLYRSLQALAISWGRQFEAGLAALEALLPECDERPGIWLEYARLLRAVRRPNTVAAHRKAIDILPSLSSAWLSFSFVKSFRMDEELAARLRAQLARPNLPAEDRARLYLAFGKASDDLKQYAPAFDSYRRSNEILGAAAPAQTGDEYLRDAKTVFVPAFFRNRTGYGCQEHGPIFIVGMPRSGSTLVEQILASHSAVDAMGEISTLTQVGMRFAPDRPGQPQGQYPYVLNTLDAERFRRIGEAYIEETRSRRPAAKPFFIDKLPANFTHIGLIHLALPNARIIDVRRHPLACCFSSYKQFFLMNMPRDQVSLARLYRNYVELTAHFDAVLPGKVYRLIYESLVDDFETEVRRLLDFIGLPFEEQCLRFHENRRVVLTVSSDQVGEALNRKGVEDWRHYEKWLGPMRHELGSVLTNYPEVPEFYPRFHVQGQRGPTYAFVNGLRCASFAVASSAAA